MRRRESREPRPRANLATLQLGNDVFAAHLAVARLRDAGIRVSDVHGLDEGQAFPTQGLWVQLTAADVERAMAILAV